MLEAYRNPHGGLRQKGTGYVADTTVCGTVAPVTMRLRPLLLLCVGVLVVAASLWYRAGAPSGGENVMYAARVRTCAAISRLSLADGLKIRDCISAALGDAYDTGEIGVVAMGIEELTSENMLLRNSCHTAVHYFMEQRVVTEANLWSVLDDAGPAPDCDWAFGMAAIVGLGALGPEVYERGEILAWCNAANNGSHVYGNCLHAIGHHAWKATASLEETVAACEEVPETHRGSCASGVLMEMFEPASQTGAAYERYAAPSIIPDLCAKWRELVSDHDTSCDHAAGYVYGLDVRDAAYVLIRGKDVTSADFKTAVGTLVTAIQNCQDLRASPSPSCDDMLVRSIPRDLAAQLPEAYREFCAAFAAGKASEACTKRADTTVSDRP